MNKGQNFIYFLTENRTYIKNNMAENSEKYLMALWVQNKIPISIFITYTLDKNLFLSENSLLLFIYLRYFLK